MQTIIETTRLILRELETESDADFIYELLNAPKFLQYIGDRGVHSVEDAREAIETRYRQSYVDNGFGFYVVELADGEVPIGICGFVKRDFLPEPDLGFAFLPEHERKGYGHESASAMLNLGGNKFGFKKVLAITSLDNDASVALLAKLGFVDDGIIEPQGEKLRLFSYAY